MVMKIVFQLHLLSSKKRTNPVKAMARHFHRAIWRFLMALIAANTVEAAVVEDYCSVLQHVLMLT
jgi:hypothetical protein